MGAFEEAKGKVKQAVGDVTDNPDLRREGQAQQDKGDAERGQGRGKRTRAAGRPRVQVALSTSEE
jgi:uncharacterized protein YjbJ (UPF0337 family)